jgi:hypothetical protein
VPDVANLFIYLFIYFGRRQARPKWKGGSEDHVPRMSPWFPLYPSVVIRPRTLSGLFVARILALDRSSGADSSTLPLPRWLSE